MKDPKRVATGKKSRRKGARNERDVAKILSIWWGCIFRRTPLSGGWAKSKEIRQEFSASGDLLCPDTTFPFLCEVKSQEGWSFDCLWDINPKHPLSKWWIQTVRETPPGKHPMLLFTRKLKSWYVMFKSPDIAALFVGRFPICHFMLDQSVYITRLDYLIQIPKENVVRAMTRRKGMSNGSQPAKHDS